MADRAEWWALEAAKSLFQRSVRYQVLVDLFRAAMEEAAAQEKARFDCGGVTDLDDPSRCALEVTCQRHRLVAEKARAEEATRMYESERADANALTAALEASTATGVKLLARADRAEAIVEKFRECKRLRDSEDSYIPDRIAALLDAAEKAAWAALREWREGR